MYIVTRLGQQYIDEFNDYGDLCAAQVYVKLVERKQMPVDDACKLIGIAPELYWKSKEIVSAWTRRKDQHNAYFS